MKKEHFFTSKRLNWICDKVKELDLDMFIVFKDVNVFYLTGFFSDAGVLCVVKNKCILITDSRYFEMASKQVNEKTEVRLSKKGVLSEILDISKEYNARKVGIESRSIHLDSYNRLKERLSRVKIFSYPDIIETKRVIKDEYEIETIEASYDITLKCLNHIKKFAKAGHSEKDLFAEVSYFMVKNGADCAAFSPIVVSNPRSSVPHAVSTSKKISNREVLLVDIGARYKIYNSDLTRILVLSRMPRNMERVYDVVCSAKKLAIKHIKPGVRVGSIDKIARDYIAEFGYGEYFGHSLGHGIGLEVHEMPFVNSGNRDIIAEGMVFTIEPGIYFPGRFGIRLEDAVLVTKNGCKNLCKKNGGFEK